MYQLMKFSIYDTNFIDINAMFVAQATKLMTFIWLLSLYIKQRIIEPAKA